VKRVAFFCLLLLAGVAVELWMTIVGMSDAFLGGVHLPSSVSDFREQWLYFGMIFGLPLVAVLLAATAIRFSRK
jgi:hypothetical protein